VSARTDHQLVEACRAGDEQAWTELIESYSALIASVPRRYGLPEHLVDEVFADVCAVLFRSLGGIRDPQALPRSIVRTPTRATWEAARRARRALPTDLPELTGAAPPEDYVAALEEEEIVRRALKAISEKCQRLLRLLYFEPVALNYDEVAARLKVPRGSLGPTRRRCLDRLRQKLPTHLGGDVSGTGASAS
jgi:RNA polymerase sigma factor (sigma-70 family)